MNIIGVSDVHGNIINTSNIHDAKEQVIIIMDSLASPIDITDNDVFKKIQYKESSDEIVPLMSKLMNGHRIMPIHKQINDSLLKWTMKSIKEWDQI